jgi:hypothetical protein
LIYTAEAVQRGSQIATPSWHQLFVTGGTDTPSWQVKQVFPKYLCDFCEILNGDCLIYTAEAVQRGSQIATPSWNELFAQEIQTHLRGREKTFLEM